MLSEAYEKDYSYYQHTITKQSTKAFLQVVRPILSTVLCTVIKRRYQPEFLSLHANTIIEGIVDTVTQNFEMMKASGHFSVRSLLPPHFPTIFKALGPVLFPSVLSQLTIKKIARKYSIPDQEIEMMWGNRRENAADQMNHSMMRMAIALKEILADHPELDERVKKLMEEKDHEGTLQLVGEFRTAMNEEEKKARFVAEWDDFMKRFGCRGPAEIDIAVPRYEHRPSMVLSMMYNLDVMGYENEEEGDRKREAAIQSVLSRVTKKRDRKKIEKNLPVAQLFLSYRETPKYTIVRMFSMIRQGLLEIGKTLVGQGLLNEENDIFYLMVEEVAQWEEDQVIGNSFKSLVEERKREMELSAQMQFPKVVIGPECIMKSVSEATLKELQNLPANMLKGLPTSAGVVEGRAVVATDPDTAVVCKGDILVAKATDPGWTPLFMPAAGVAIEIGGPLTHGSVVARERGIPCVVGIMGLMDKIKTGMRIRVDGNKGIVEILEE